MAFKRKPLPGSTRCETHLGGDFLGIVNTKWRLAWEIVDYGRPGADLAGVDLSGAHLPLSNLAGANLAGANLSNTDLSRTTLANANLSESNRRCCINVGSW